jgi:hypothetical protein
MYTESQVLVVPSTDVLPGIIPTLGLKIFLALVPIVLTMSSVLVAALPSESAVDFDVGRKFHLFQFVVVFLFLTIFQAMSTGGSTEGAKGDSDENKVTSDEALPMVALVKQLIEEPKEITTLLGTSIPQVVRFPFHQHSCPVSRDVSLTVPMTFCTVIYCVFLCNWCKSTL